MWIKTCLMIVLGLAAGGAIAGAYVAGIARSVYKIGKLGEPGETYYVAGDTDPVWNNGGQSADSI